MGRNASLLRSRKLETTANGTRWLTDAGGLFIEPVQRPDVTNGVVDLTIHLSRAHFRLLEVLHDDVASYIDRLIRSHIEGLIKSAEYNAQQRKVTNADKNEKQ